ncbi:MAG: hypothetical protein P4L55_16090 [Syntrophobacteraceae bacterium]|nr:hypothetical protein [Syntrophobacteraceae bacterium]
MSENRDRMKVSTALPWFLCVLLVFALLFLLVEQRGGQVAVYEATVRENEILSTMRLNLLRAAEAEKSAVLAVTDEQSQRFADQARIAALQVDKARRELDPLIARDNSQRETSRMGEFYRCWTESKKLDRLILDLAVQNTNFHATNLALTKGARALSDLERNLTGLIDPNNAPEGGNVRVVRLAYQAIVAGLKIHDLYTPHIEAETGEQMDKIEKEIKANQEVLTNSLNGLGRSIQGGGMDAVKKARADYSELARITQEIVDLSRKNTNIKSLKLSLGKKRLLTAQCDEILSGFQELIRRKGSKATR